MMRRVAALVFLLQVAHLTQGAKLDGGAGTRVTFDRAVGGPMMDMAQLVALDVKCGRSGMSVQLEFDRVFPGVVYSKGHFYDPACNYVTIKNSRKKKFTFNVPIEGCGTIGQLGEATPTQDMYFENTIIIQTDPVIQEEWDVARNIRCTWQHTLQKSVVATPFKVYQPKKVLVSLDARSINTLMEIQEGAGPFAGPATGYVHMGDDISVVIYVQDPTHKMDANVVSCNASSAGGRQVALVDGQGCLARPDLLTPFVKTRKTNGVDADLMLYSYLKAFNIGESPEFTINCHLEVCEGKCSDPCPAGLSHSRVRRQQPSDPQPSDPRPRSALVELQRSVMIVAREPLIGVGEVCWLDSWVLVTGVVLVSAVAFLSTLSCILALKLTSLRQQVQHKPVY